MTPLHGRASPFLIAILLTACTDSTDVKVGDTDTDTLTESDPPVFGTFCTGTSVSLSTPSGELSGAVTVAFTLVHPEEEAANVSLSWTANGVTWADATVTGTTNGLATTEAGETYELQWDTLTDLGEGSYDSVQLKLGVTSACGGWDPATEDDLVVNNDPGPPPECWIEAYEIVETQAGDVILSFSLAHPLSTDSWVTTEWSTDGGTAWSPLIPAEADCNGDLVDDDDLDSLATTPEGMTHCFIWDSDADLNDDVEVLVRMSCGVGGDQQASTTTTFMVENDPTPAPGDLILTELMPRSSFPGGNYLELYSLAPHTLDLEGVEVQRWDDGDSPAGPPTTSFTLSVPSGTLLVDPGGYFLLAGSDDADANGCLAPDYAWGDDFTLYDRSSVGLAIGSTPLAYLDFFDDDIWDFSSREAWGLDPSSYASPTWTDPAGWCPQTTVIAGCTAVQSPGTIGTPGTANNTCAP